MRALGGAAGGAGEVGREERWVGGERGEVGREGSITHLGAHHSVGAIPWVPLRVPHAPAVHLLRPPPSCPQVVDDVKGPVTRKDFDVFTVPAGDDTFGRVHDHIGRHLPAFDSPQQQQQQQPQEAAGGKGAAAGSARVAPPVTRPLLNAQVEMKNREQINESLLTGVKVRPVPPRGGVGMGVGGGSVSDWGRRHGVIELLGAGTGAARDA